MYDVSIENDFDFLAPEYRELFARSAATAFQHPVWLAGIYRHLIAHNRATPLVVVVRARTDGKPVLVLPLVRRRYAAMKTIEFADLRVSDYVAPVAEPEILDRLAANREVRHAVQAALRPYDLMRIGKLDWSAPALEALLGTRPRRPMLVRAYAVPLEADFSRWRALRLGASYRKELDKKGRQFARKGTVRFGCAEGGEVEAVLAAMRQHRGLRFADEGGDLMQVAPYYAFYSWVAEAGAGELVRTYGLWLDGRVVAGAVGLSHRGALLVVLSAFDAAFKNQSLGSLMFERVAADAIARGDTLLDFTIGDEPYKLTFGAEPRPVGAISRTGSPLGLAAGLAIEHLPAARALARRLFHTARDAGARAPAPGTAAID